MLPYFSFLFLFLAMFCIGCFKFAWTDSALVVLDKWSSYRGGRLSRFDCISKKEI